MNRTVSWADPITHALRDGFESAADAEQAAPMRAYMKDRFEFYGIRSPDRKVAQRAAVRGAARPSDNELLDLADWCWDQPQREYQYAATDLLRKWQAVLEPTVLPHVRALVTTKSWWDTVDALAAHVIGALAKRDAATAQAMDDWIDDDDIWVARTAILHQLTWKDDTDASRLFSYCSRRAGHPDFFIRKAIGWALRQYARVDPAAVLAFADATPELSPLSRREALKHL